MTISIKTEKKNCTNQIVIGWIDRSNIFLGVQFSGLIEVIYFWIDRSNIFNVI
jgi:hypothetical protein